MGFRGFCAVRRGLKINFVQYLRASGLVAERLKVNPMFTTFMLNISTSIYGKNRNVTGMLKTTTGTRISLEPNSGIMIQLMLFIILCGWYSVVGRSFPATVFLRLPVELQSPLLFAVPSPYPFAGTLHVLLLCDLRSCLSEGG